MASRLSGREKLRSLIKVTSVATVIYSGICIYQGNEKFYNKFVVPVAQSLDPEFAHKAAVMILKWGLLAKQNSGDPSSLGINVWGLQFRNPIGMAAGFDKQGEAVEGLHRIGFSFVEIGSITPKPQPGNPKPRIFRLLEDNAVVNRYGFNSEGHHTVWERVKKLKENQDFNGIVGINLGKNKTSKDTAEDYVEGIKKFSDVADYFVINVSSPNTPGLRGLQSKKELEHLLIKVNETRRSLGTKQPLLLKLAPDLTASEKQDIADVILEKKSKVDGLILCNTTVSRNNLLSPLKEEPGGLSGAPLSDMSTAMISDMYERTKGSIPIIGVGGIFSGEDAYRKIKAGASLVQLYTAFTYRGPPVVGKIKKELEDMLKRDGLASIKDAIGKDVHSR